MPYLFTVLLLRPDYLADAFGQDTYTAFVAVDADDPAQACLVAQREVIAKDCSQDDALHTDPEDYFPLFVCPGHVQNLAGGVLSMSESASTQPSPSQT